MYLFITSCCYETKLCGVEIFCWLDQLLIVNLRVQTTTFTTMYTYEEPNAQLSTTDVASRYDGGKRVAECKSSLPRGYPPHECRGPFLNHMNVVVRGPVQSKFLLCVVDQHTNYVVVRIIDANTTTTPIYDDRNVNVRFVVGSDDDDENDDQNDGSMVTNT
ncbi:hypothetical protein M3Y94_00381300 [Aphelenchoides besseyi]|nr:hypothetical protein M3Y94_00381300 [Aphelenchoides besseyi]